MDGIKMNQDMGEELRRLCKPYRSGRLRNDFVVKARIKPALLELYFRGKKDICMDHLSRLASACNTDLDSFKAQILSVYRTEEEKKREKEIADEQYRLWLEEDRLRNEKRKREEAEAYCKWCEEHPEILEAQRKKQELLEKTRQELQGYGIDKKIHRLYEGNLEEFLTGPYRHPLQYIMTELCDKTYLPQLEHLLSAHSDEDLYHEHSNALMWAINSPLAYEKLLLLKDRKEFIAANIHAKYERGETILHQLADSCYDDGEAICLLVEWGADVNAQDRFLWTPLHYAADHYENNDLRWRALVDCGADLTIRDNTGSTPGEAASEVASRIYGIDAW